MLSTKHAKLGREILIVILIAALAFFFVRTKLPETEFIRDSIQSVEDSRNTVMSFSAATLSASLAISALPDDFATPLAESLADMNIYFVAILVILALEELLILYGVKSVFAYVIPAACAIWLLAVVLKRDFMKNLALRVAILGLALALVVPCSTHLTNIVASDLNEYVETTIADTEAGADKINEVMENESEEKTIFERLSEFFRTAIDSVSDLALHYRNTIRRCMNSIAILLLTNCLMPLMNFFLLRWVLKETFQITIPLPRRLNRRSRVEDEEDETELAVIGE